MLNVLFFYATVLRKSKALLLVTVFCGLLTRLLTVSTFILTVKVFLEVIRPSEVSETLASSISFLYKFVTIQSVDPYAVILISFLLLLFVIQYVISKLYLHLSNKLISNHVGYFFMDYKQSQHSNGINFSLNNLSIGIDASIKILEIICFFWVLFVLIYLVSPTIFFIMMVLVSFMLLLLVYLNRKDITYITKGNNLRRKVIINPKLLSDYLKVRSQQRAATSNNINNSRFLGGIAIVCMIFTYLLGGPYDEVNDLKAIVLVFSIRFVIIYAGEFSRQVNQLTRQRKLVFELQDAS